MQLLQVKRRVYFTFQAAFWPSWLSDLDKQCWFHGIIQDACRKMCVMVSWCNVYGVSASCTLCPAPEGDPEGVDHAGDVGEEGQQDVQQEVAPTPPHLGWGVGGVFECNLVY